MPKLFFEMTLVDEYGHVHGRLRREIHEKAAYIGNRIVNEMKAGAAMGIPLVSFEEAVEVMRVKELRRGLLVSAATQVGGALADHLEDREGWHGLDRQERVEAQYEHTL